MKKIVVVAAAFAFVLSAGSVNAFMHDKLQKQLEDAAKQLEQQMQKKQNRPKKKSQQQQKSSPAQKQQKSSPAQKRSSKTVKYTGNTHHPDGRGDLGEATLILDIDDLGNFTGVGDFTFTSRNLAGLGELKGSGPHSGTVTFTLCSKGTFRGTHEFELGWGRFNKKFRNCKNSRAGKVKANLGMLSGQMSVVKFTVASKSYFKEQEREAKIAAAAKAGPQIEGFTAKQSKLINNLLVPYYFNYRNMKALCTKKGAAPFQDAVKKYFNAVRIMLKTDPTSPFSPKTKWDKITDAAWKMSTPQHQKYVSDEKMMFGMYDMMSDRERVNTCRTKVLPDQIRIIRLVRKQIEKLNRKNSKKGPTTEKKDF